MSNGNQVINYTTGDREVLTRLDQKMDDLIESLQNPFPRCAANIERLKSLEDSRSRWQKVSIGAFLAMFGVALKTFWVFLTKGM
jgi:hypothetical protein